MLERAFIWNLIIASLWYTVKSVAVVLYSHVQKDKHRNIIIWTAMPPTQNQRWYFVRFGITCTIFKTVKNTHGRVLLLVKLQLQPKSLLKVTFLHGRFSRFLNCTNNTKLRNASQRVVRIHRSRKSTLIRCIGLNLTIFRIPPSRLSQSVTITSDPLKPSRNKFETALSFLINPDIVSVVPYQRRI